MCELNENGVFKAIPLPIDRIVISGARPVLLALDKNFAWNPVAYG